MIRGENCGTILGKFFCNINTNSMSSILGAVPGGALPSVGDKRSFDQKVADLRRGLSAHVELTPDQVARVLALENRQAVGLTREEMEWVLALDERKAVPFYPQRMAEAVDAELVVIEGLVSGKEPKIVLDEETKPLLLAEEDKLGDTLEKILALNGSSSLDINLDYFLTLDGRELLASLLPWHSNIIPEDRDGLRKFFYKHSYAVAALSKEERSLLESTSHHHATATLEHELTIDPELGLQLNAAAVPEQLTVLLNPGAKAKKIAALRAMRKEIKQEVKKIDIFSVEDRSELGKARREIFQMYLRRINELIADEYPSLYYVAKKEQVVGGDDLTEEERDLLKFAVGKKNINKSLSRFDKLVYGASPQIDARGNKTQLSTELQRFKVVSDVSHSDAELAAQKGLDIHKLRKKNITAAQRKAWAERIFEAYGVEGGKKVKDQGKDKSNGAWEYVISPTRKSLVVTPRSRTVTDKNSDGDVVSALSVAMNHEIEGHVLQEINRRTIPLRMFRGVKGDRYLAFSEAGAVDNEEKFVQNAFGLQREQSYAYGAAIEAKLVGGDYLDAVKAFFDNRLQVLRLKYPDLSSDLAQQELHALKATAIDRAKRIFRDADITPFEDVSKDVRYSKDTLYMERKIIMEKLEAHGLRKLAFLGGMNLDNVATLIRLGMLDLDQVMEPKGVAMEIWNEIKHTYMLVDPTIDNGRDI